MTAAEFDMMHPCSNFPKKYGSRGHSAEALVTRTQKKREIANHLLNIVLIGGGMAL